MKRFVFILFIFCFSAANAENALDSIAKSDTIGFETIAKEKKPSLFKRGVKFVSKVFDWLNDIDTTYIEPQHYNFTAMIQNTNTYEVYTLKSKKGSSIRFSPEPNIKIGPYFGWRWVFLGYTFDVLHLNTGTKKELDLSFYTSAFGLDLFYRKTGNDYKLRSININNGNTTTFDNVKFDGLNVGIKGLNIYYIFNHKHFSYPAAFSQSTRQKKSCGSAMLGVGITKHDIDFDYNKLQQTLQKNIAGYDQEIDEGLMFSKAEYLDLSVSGGYAYNFVFAKNWLLSASLSLAVGYKRSVGDVKTQDREANEFSFNNLNIDGVGRFGIVWNNDKWFAGASTIIHSYNYSKPQFQTSNIFGNLNVYFGMNFGKRKEYKK